MAAQRTRGDVNEMILLFIKSYIWARDKMTLCLKISEPRLRRQEFSSLSASLWLCTNMFSSLGLSVPTELYISMVQAVT